MAFSKKYKTLGDVLLAYQLHFQKEDFKFTHRKTASRKWLEEFRFDLNEIPFDASEAMIREIIIFPILRLSWKPFSAFFTIWGHKFIEADEVLNGTPDYIIAKRSELGNIVFDEPYIAVIEAKTDDFTGGWAQCTLEMLAIQKINKEKNIHFPVFGIVTNGESWQFAKLNEGMFIEYRQSFALGNINEIISALTTMFEYYKALFQQNLEVK
jgi:hypothetical protein